MPFELMNDRKIKITFTETEKRVDIESIASAVAKTMRKGGMKNVKRTEVS